MKRILICIIVLVTLKLNAQIGVNWQKCLGGIGDEVASSIQQTSDGGYIIAGYTNSQNGDVSGNHGKTDSWIVKINSTGNLQWQKCFGGSEDDKATSIQQTSDSGYIFVGSTYSIDGDVVGNHGGMDSWIVKLNSIGAIQWKKCLGGSIGPNGEDGIDEAVCVQQTSDGGYIISGNTNSTDGDFSDNHGDQDSWVIKLNSIGNLQWKKCLGGSKEEFATSIQQTSDGGYIIAGSTRSIDGDVSGNNGGVNAKDAWIVKINSSGTIQWQKCIGGSSGYNGWGDDDFASSIQQTSDGGYILAGHTNSQDGDVSGNHGLIDSWVVKLNSTSSIEWQKCLGGTNFDEAKSIKQTSDGGYIVAGYTMSNDGDITGNHGNTDSWVAKLNSNGSLQWQKLLGLSDYEGANCIQPTVDGGYIIAGYTNSKNATHFYFGDVFGNHGGNDSWIVKLNQCTNSSSILNVSSCSSYTSPSGQTYSSNGDYQSIIPNHIGCDSLITIHLKITQPVTNKINDTTCLFPYIWNGISYNEAGVYSQTLSTVNGCDSTVQLTLNNYIDLYNSNICIISNDSKTGKNKLIWEKPKTNGIDSYNVYRESNQTGIFDLIGNILYSDSSLFTDNQANNNNQAYKYKLKYVDKCGNENTNIGNPHKTIHLTINQGVGNIWNLIWTPYEGFTYPSYNIYRGTNASNMTLITTIASNLTSYTDANAPSGYIYYQIEIVSPTNCIPTKSLYYYNSRSNISTNNSNYLGLYKTNTNTINIYPNPANNNIRIDYDGQIQKVEILDLKGAIVYTTNEPKNELNLPQNIQSGYYTVVIQTAEGAVRKELMIQK